ncbi:MAG TPA: hypothetical protein VK867_02795 [Candidatus Limnocylindrales bacterium]|nr:hypothetical protein [Candidatus Limnocylindrales bacterium]
MTGDGTADFDLHGAVGIRLLGARPREIALVERQLGPLRSRLDHEPDLLIRFVDQMPLAGGLRLLGLDEAAYTDDAYLILRGRHKSEVKVAVPFDRIGGDGPCELVVERGLSAIPQLVGIVNLVVLRNGLLPLHGGAFVHKDKGILTIGWAKGGKSETMLAFTAHGAELVGDEWVYLDPVDCSLRALPEPMRVWDWQIRSVDGLSDRIPAGDRRRLAATRLMAAGLRGVSRLPVVGRRGVGRAASRARVLVEKQLSVQVPTERLLGRPARTAAARLDRLVLVGSHASDEVTVGPVDPADVARRATQSFLFELSDLLGHYRRFRFAFPARSNPLIDDLESRYEAMAVSALANVPAISVGHPYPLEIDRLYRAIDPALD